MNQSILIKFPSRSRPNKFFSCLENIKSLIGIDDYIICCALDLDDPTMNNKLVKERLNTYDKLRVYWGISKSKIHAINRNVPLDVDWKYLVCVADDFWFLKKNFGKQIISDFEKYFPDTDGLLHYPDGRVNKKLVTLPVMGRKYYERFGYIYNSEYVSVKADKEQMEVAQILGKYKYVPIQIADHRHPRWNFGEKDDQLKMQDSPLNYAKDGMTFNKRKMERFGL